MFTINAIEALGDNYIWCLTFTAEKLAVVVDPGDAAPVIDYLNANDLTLHAILNTHHHYDHTRGIKALLEYQDVPVYGPQLSPNQLITQRLTEGDTLNILGLSMRIHEKPAHTFDHIFYKIAKSEDHEQDIIFCGDTMFRAGCGRLFEGSPTLLYRAMSWIAEQDPGTLLYPTHEYSIANLAFAAAVEPLNADIVKTAQWCREQRAKNLPTLPTSVEQELQTNPYMRVNSQSVIDAAQKHASDELTTPEAVTKALRRWKDSF